jgi:hypothetical protein
LLESNKPVSVASEIGYCAVEANCVVNITGLHNGSICLAKLIQKIFQIMRYGYAPIFLLLVISEHLKPIIAQKIAIL